MNSIWTESVQMPHFDSLKGDARTEVLIIGGGMAGILCAHFLQEMGVDYMLVEGKNIGAGITKNTTAKITSQHGLIYAKLYKELGAEKTKLYLEINQNAVKKYEELCQHIDFDFEEKTNYVYSLNDRKRLEDEVAALEKIGFHAHITETKELPFSTAGAVGFGHQAQFHPLNFLSWIAGGLRIYEHTFVKALSEHEAQTECGRITFRNVIIATHFPFANNHGLYFLKMYQHRSYVLALDNAAIVDGMYVDEADKGMSFRNYGNILLLGGGGHRTGKQGGNWQELRDFAQKHYPAAKETGFWATQDCMTLDSVPYIGQYSPNTLNWYVMTGFNKWGMTSSMVAAMIVSDLATGKKNPYAEVFDPSRSMWKPQLFLNGLESTKNLLTISEKRCPHLGCALKWNSAERSWDCPCHGSRFQEDGKLIDNPATGDLELQNAK